MVKLLIKILISIGLISILLYKIDIHAFTAMLTRIGPIQFLGLALIYLTSQIISSIRWHMIIKSLGEDVSTKDLFKLYLMGMFANLFLPSIIGGDGVKAYMLSKQIGWQKSISSIFLERYNGLLALLALSLVSLIAFFKLFSIKIAIIVIAANIFAIVGIFFLRFFNHPKLKKFYQDIALFHKSDKLITVSALSVLVQVSVILVYILTGKLLGFKVSTAYYFAFIPIITLISFLPVSFNGIGVREFSFVYFFKFAHLNSTQSVSLSVAVFFVVVFCSLLGGVFYLDGRILKEIRSVRKKA
ncbi:lysylphosphatidylglycerol synthase transmembrane domain-containing protein [Hippea sp. KM1]|uniref:lysylphosphatidylglycerol synthase transmembrane domain-containing protein n=1 Tax=Hippea sp. KM1 TaxID=944481 RepID=UPI00046CC51E|nr:lysylphosphatidylglycerol synthase transmembrane domain-containing protein [Hippea sp. KM1]